MLDIDKIMRPEEQMPKAFQSLTGAHQMKYWQDVLDYAKANDPTNETAEQACMGSFPGLRKGDENVIDGAWDLLCRRIETVDALLDDCGICPLQPSMADRLLADRAWYASEFVRLGVYVESMHGRMLLDIETLEPIDPSTLGLADLSRHKQLCEMRAEQHRSLRAAVEVQLGR